MSKDDINWFWVGLFGLLVLVALGAIVWAAIESTKTKTVWITICVEDDAEVLLDGRLRKLDAGGAYVSETEPQVFGGRCGKWHRACAKDAIRDGQLVRLDGCFGGL